MSKEKNLSVLEEAVSELKAILEAADKNAKDRIAKEMPKKFDSVLKEELNKLNKKETKESVQESAKKDNVKEPLKEGKKADDKKESLNETEFDMRDMSINDVEEAFDGANASDEFQVADDEINLSDIEKELGEMEVMAGEIDNIQKEEASVNNNNDPFEKIRQIHEMMSEMIKQMDDAKMHEAYGQEFEQKMSEMYGAGYKEELGEAVTQMYEKFVANKGGKSQEAAPIQETHELDADEVADEKKVDASSIKEEEGEAADEKRDEKELDEAGHGSTLAQNKVAGANQLPKPENAQYKENKYRYALRNENYQKRMTSLLDQNKKVSKELSEAKSQLKKVTDLVNEQKNVLVKYRNQLQEMAVFNTNLAHVNNLFVNESLALTAEDKKEIINKFKGIDSINESEKTYKSVLSEMTKGKKTITESIEDKVNNSIQPSASKEIVEAVSEKTGFAVNEHVKKIKGLMNYVDSHGKKNILK